MMHLNEIKTNLLVLGAAVVVGGSKINWITNEITIF